MTTPVPLVIKNAGIAIEDGLAAVVRRQVRQPQVDAYCGMYRRSGISKLLLTGRPQLLFDDLARSARVLVHFLDGASEAAKVTSASHPFLDAVACGDDAAARDIARLSRTTPNPEDEYEDDFLWFRFLMDRFALGAAATTLDALLARWSTLAADGDDPRLAFCRAIVAKDPHLLDDAIDGLAAARQAELREARDAGALPPDEAASTAKVWVDLVALLHLAESIGLPTAGCVPMAPPLARRRELARLPPADAWRRPRSYREFT